MNSNKAAERVSNDVDPDATRAVSARLREDQIAALDQVRVRVGIPVTEQIRRAVDLWLAAQESK